MTVNRRIGLFLLAMAGGACARPSPAPRSPASVATPPAPAAAEPPAACYARDAAPPRAGDVEVTEDPTRSVFALDREMLPELARRLDHPSEAQRRSSLDNGIVQMVARRHAGEVRECQAALLAKAPGKGGTVTARFLIGADGQVRQAHVVASTVDDAATEDCIGQNVCGWRFPALAQGHTLVLEYPFLLPAGAASAAVTGADRK